LAVHQAILSKPITMTDIQRLKKDYPWIQTPLIVGAPMRLIALADMAAEITKAGMSPPPIHPFHIPHHHSTYQYGVQAV
jgi:hypothetical protein